MSFEKNFGVPEPQKNIDDVLKSLDDRNELAAKKIKLEMIADAGLNSDCTVSIESAPGHKIAKIFLSEKGVYTCAKLNSNQEFTLSHQSANETNVGALEEKIIMNHTNAIRDYLSAHSFIFPTT